MFSGILKLRKSQGVQRNMRLGYGVKVIPWTANRPEQWKRLIEIGVDGIVSDDPKLLIDFLSARGLRTGASLPSVDAS